MKGEKGKSVSPWDLIATAKESNLVMSTTPCGLRIGEKIYA